MQSSLLYNQYFLQVYTDFTSNTTDAAEKYTSVNHW